MNVLSLEYHDVVESVTSLDASGFPGRAADSYKMIATDFIAHLDSLRGVSEVGLDVRSLGQADRPVLLTFDDGGASCATVVAPLLEARGYRGHFFITTERIGTPGFCTAEQIRGLAAAGHIVGSHSHTHPIRMGRLSIEALRAEWSSSVGHLGEILGGPISTASVPGGYFNGQVAMAAAHAGIEWLFTSEPTMTVDHADHTAILGRYTLRRASSSAEVERLVGRLGLERARHWLGWNTKKLAKAVAGRTYLRIRAALFRDRDGTEA